MDDKQLIRELAKEMINPIYFFDRALQIGFKIALESHHFNHANSNFFIKPNYPDFGIEARYINKVIKELSVFYARLLNQYKFKYQIIFQQDLRNRMKLIKY